MASWRVCPSPRLERPVRARAEADQHFTRIARMLSMFQGEIAHANHHDLHDIHRISTPSSLPVTSRADRVVPSCRAARRPVGAVGRVPGPGEEGGSIVFSGPTEPAVT